MSQEIQWLKIWEKFQIQDALDNITKLEALRKSNKELVNWLKNRSENELKLYAKWILEQKISYASDDYFPELKWGKITDELITQEVIRIKDRVKNSWAKNMDDMWYLLVTFLEKIWQVETKKEENKAKIVGDTRYEIWKTNNSLTEPETIAIINASKKIVYEQSPTPVKEIKHQEVNPILDKNLGFQMNKEVKIMLEKWEIWKINSLQNMPWVSFIKYDNQEVMNKSWWRITAFTENDTIDFKDPKSWSYAWWHDLSSESIANYFNRFKNLTSAETALKNNLKNTWIIKEEKNWKIKWIENKAVLVMFYPEWDKVKFNWAEMNWNAIREKIKWWLNHELAHWLYFTNPEFKKITHDVWDSLDEKTRKEISWALSKNYKNVKFHPTEFLSYIIFTWDKKDIISNTVPEKEKKHWLEYSENYVDMLRDLVLWILNTKITYPSDDIKSFFVNNQEIEK